MASIIKAGFAVVLFAAWCDVASSAAELEASPAGKDASRWDTKDGWVMRKAPGEKSYKKFFATGLWNIPGYTERAMEQDPELYRSSARPYLEKSGCYNLVYLPAGDDSSVRKRSMDEGNAMNGHKKRDRVEVIGSVGFHEALKDYQQEVFEKLKEGKKLSGQKEPGLGKGNSYDYQIRRYAEESSGSKEFTRMLDAAIEGMCGKAGRSDHIWAPIDEIAGGGAGSGWCWSPKVGEAIRKRLLRKEPNTLVYTDLVGISRGNTHLFERRYLKSHKRLPPEPPFEALGKDAKLLPDRPLLGFVQAYDGSPVYVNGTADYKEYGLDDLRRFFYENLRLCARDYRDCGDVFGINSFIDCNTYPVLAGVAVDGIKAGAGSDTPVWIFFDGNGYARPSGQDAVTFIKNLKCQMYTSIIHGATGVMFWNDRSLSPEIFNDLECVVAELEKIAPLLEGRTLRTSFEGDVHLMIKNMPDGHRLLLAANTSPDSAAQLSFESVQAILSPYEVKVLIL